MFLEELKELPKLYRVIKIDLHVLRPCFYSGERDCVETRKVRRVLCKNGDWKWQIARDCKYQDEWDYFLEEDQECLDNSY